MATSWTKSADFEFLPAEGSESDDDAREQQSKAQSTGAPGGRWARQAAYRQRKAAKQAELAAQAEATRVAIEAAQNERASLHAEHAALQAAQLYQEQLLDAARQAAAAGAVEQQVRQQLLAELEAEHRHEAGGMWAPAAHGPSIVSVPASDSVVQLTAGGSGDKDKGPCKSKSSSSGDGGATSQPMSDAAMTPTAAGAAAAAGGDGRCASTGATALGPATAGGGAGAAVGAAPLPAHSGVHGSSAQQQAWNAASAVQDSEPAAAVGMSGVVVETPTTAATAVVQVLQQPYASSDTAFLHLPNDSIPAGTLGRIQREAQQALVRATAGTQWRSTRGAVLPLRRLRAPVQPQNTTS